MWTKSHSITTRSVTKEQMWNLFSDVANWNKWDNGIDSSSLHSKFEAGHYITLKPAGGPTVKIELLEVVPCKRFLDRTNFPLAKMWDDHTFEETSQGLKITHTITVKGILSALWVKLVAGKMAAGLPADMQRQIEAAAAYPKTI